MYAGRREPKRHYCTRVHGLTILGKAWRARVTITTERITDGGGKRKRPVKVDQQLLLAYRV